jgi:trehalose 6-phosphate phosphatase
VKMQALPRPPILDTERVALFLDLDGTIAEISERPGDVGPLAKRTRLLGAIGRALNGRLAILTGRTLEDVDRILEGAVMSVAAVHGLVRRLPDSSVIRTEAAPQLAKARRAFEAMALAEPALIVEDKGASVALHYRQVPGAERAAREATSRIAPAMGLVVQHGSMVSELLTPGPDKGDALRTFQDDPRFTGFQPVMVGDDLTDEPAFAAANALGGYGVRVGSPRATAARFGLEGVSEVLAWLAPGLRA